MNKELVVITQGIDPLLTDVIADLIGGMHLTNYCSNVFAYSDTEKDTAGSIEHGFEKLERLTDTGSNRVILYAGAGFKERLANVPAATKMDLNTIEEATIASLGDPSPRNTKKAFNSLQGTILGLLKTKE